MTQLASVEIKSEERICVEVFWKILSSELLDNIHSWKLCNDENLCDEWINWLIHIIPILFVTLKIELWETIFINPPLVHFSVSANHILNWKRLFDVLRSIMTWELEDFAIFHQKVLFFFQSSRFKKMYSKYSCQIGEAFKWKTRKKFFFIPNWRGVFF